MKYCAYCGKEVKENRSKYCSRECYHSAPKLFKGTQIKDYGQKKCEACGKPLTRIQMKSHGKYCSYKCARPFLKGVTTQQAEQRNQAFIDRFNNKYLGSFVYLSGYNGSEGKFICQCVKCGKPKAVFANCVRAGHMTPVCECDKKAEATKQRTLRQELNRVVKEQRALVRSQQQEERKLRLQERQLAITVTIRCTQCGEEFVTANSHKKYCSVICARRYGDRTKETKRRMRAQEAGKIDWTITLDKLIKRDKGKCHICGMEIDKSDFYVREDGTVISGDMYPSIDHVRAIVNGGLHQWDNVKLAHRVCNSLKNDSQTFVNKDGQVEIYI